MSTPFAAAGRAGSSRRVVIVALTLILAATALRGWALWGSWFYGDDIKFLSQAATEPLTLDYLFTRHQQQLMPGALLWTWSVGQGPAFAWWLAGTSVLLAQVIASLSCLAFLHEFLGPRRALLVPLAFYLFCPLTIGPFMWWAAAINQLPMQACFFLALAALTRYARTPSWWLLGLGILAVAVSLLFYIKSFLIVGFLPMFALALLCRGRGWARLTELLRRFLWWWVSLGVLATGYAAVYLTSGSSPVGQAGDVPYGLTADVQVRRTFGPTLLGGPWWWEDPGRPDQLADTPEWAVTISWIVLALVVALACLRHPTAWRAVALVVVYLVPSVYLTASGRATEFGPDVGRYVRYLSDAAVVVTVAIAAVVANRDPRPLPAPMDRWRLAAPVAAGLFLAGSVWSTLQYARVWHEPTALRTFVKQASADVRNREVTRFIDQPVADALVLGRNKPFDLPSNILAPLKGQLMPVTEGRDLRIFGGSGRLERALVIPGLAASSTRDCTVGLTADRPRRVTLTDLGGPREWLQVSTISNQDAELTVRLDDTVVDVDVDSGPQTWLAKVGDVGPDVTLTSTHDLCVDSLAVGAVSSFG